MVERKQYALVIGCGERGAAWTATANEHGSEEVIIGLDLKKPRVKHGQLILGDVFNLPIKDYTIDRIYADFIVNGLIDREIAAHQIYENPNLLDSSYFPPLIRRWFVESMKRSHDSTRGNIREVGTLLKTVAMREMWRILANNGCLEILDFEYNTNWIAHYASQIVQVNPMFLKLQPLPITSEDFERSTSLRRVVKGSTYVQKLKLTKSLPPVGTNLPLTDAFGRRL